MSQRSVLLMIVCCVLCMAPTCIPPIPVPPDSSTTDAGVDVVIDTGTVDVMVMGDAFPASPCGRACAQLTVLDCPEKGPNCVATCERVITTKLTPFKPDCIATAQSVDAVRKCPAIKCEK